MTSLRSGFDPDKIIQQDEERRAAERRAEEISARERGRERSAAGRSKGTGKASGTVPPPAVIPAAVPYAGILFEPLAYRATDKAGKPQSEKALLTYDKSLE